MLFKSLVAEAIGVFALCFIGAGSIMINAHLGDKGPGLLGIALAHGIILSIAVTATMNVSGGHINPAVTFAMLLTGRISLPNAVAYVIAQLAGGVVAGLLLVNVIFVDIRTPDGQFVVDTTKAGTPMYDVAKLDTSDPGKLDVKTMNERHSSGPAAFKAIVIEAIMTFLLVFAIFGTAVDPRHPNVGGFGIGLTIAADILMGGPLTGGAMNPARVVGTGLIPALMNGFPQFWAQQWVYWVGPCAGAALAALVYQNLVLAKPNPGIAE